MGQSPFHGIFSFSDDSPAGTASLTRPDSPAYAKTPPPPPASGVGQIAVDIFEQSGYYIIRAPLAGVKLSDIDIEIDGRVVTIKGERKQSDDIPQDQMYLQECFWGEFSRSVTLPFTIDPKKVKATFSKDAVLKVLIPKEERVKVVRVSEGS